MCDFLYSLLWVHISEGWVEGLRWWPRWKSEGWCSQYFCRGRDQYTSAWGQGNYWAVIQADIRVQAAVQVDGLDLSKVKSCYVQAAIQVQAVAQNFIVIQVRGKEMW